ncbi:MAG: hypothetical protein AB7F43_14160 [Bacteriovoracia bacterium]
MKKFSVLVAVLFAMSAHAFAGVKAPECELKKARHVPASVVEQTETVKASKARKAN